VPPQWPVIPSVEDGDTTPLSCARPCQADILVGLYSGPTNCGLHAKTVKAKIVTHGKCFIHSSKKVAQANIYVDIARKTGRKKQTKENRRKRGDTKNKIKQGQ